ncbi:hypothetical protein GCM10007877_12030 [Marinibactrum halimedae]|uniref:Uncharacterized protein n=1 Tax=Marinibactrum halimedae TaxID=1444977 RepID=A0AA37WL14_9GAMM|nr:hypothetical protein GCM10007877_12030 [Marinibactrum halimedae]
MSLTHEGYRRLMLWGIVEYFLVKTKGMFYDTSFFSVFIIKAVVLKGNL